MTTFLTIAVWVLFVAVLVSITVVCLELINERAFASAVFVSLVGTFIAFFVFTLVREAPQINDDSDLCEQLGGKYLRHHHVCVEEIHLDTPPR